VPASEFDALRQQVTTLTNQVASLEAEVAAFRAATAALFSARLQAVEPAVVETSEATAPSSMGDAPTTVPSESTSRRSLLKWSGLGPPAAPPAAGGAPLAAPTAHARNGANLLLGMSNTAESVTGITYDGVSGFTQTFFVDGSNQPNMIALSAHMTG